MKKISYNFITLIIIFCTIFLNGCKKDFLVRKPIGVISENSLLNKQGIDKLLIGAYASLDRGTIYGAFYLFGSVASDEANFGSTGSIVPPWEYYNMTPNQKGLNQKWTALYTGVQRANDVLRSLKKMPSGEISTEHATQVKAEARFLRGIYHLQLAEIWRNVPYIGENVDYENNNYKVPNTKPIWPKIEADFKFAADSLTSAKQEVGRANSWAAKAFLVKTYMFEHKYDKAKPLLDDIIKNGVTSNGLKYALCDQYWDNWDPAKRNNSESVFAVQMAVHDGTLGHNGNLKNGLGITGPFGGPVNSFGWFQPTFDLANSFKTDSITGLPLIYTFNDTVMKNDHGVPPSAPFTPYAGTVDPRLDWTVGRRGIPYLDYGIDPGESWVRFPLHFGPYINKKGMAPLSEPQFVGNASYGVNHVLIRFAQVLLWAAEVEVEIGSLDKAEEYVNKVRARASNPNGWVHTYIDPSQPLKGVTNIPAANYKIGLYPPGYFQSRGKNFARDAVHFEEKLEFGMEGVRFFELQRWDNGTGSMANVLNAYLKEATSIPGFVKYGEQLYKDGARFKKGVNEIFPIPQVQIDLSNTEEGPTLVQNKGY